MRTLTTRVAVLCLAATAAGAQRAPVKLPPRPVAPPPSPVVLPKVTYDSLPNGLRFAVVENHELPLVVVQTAIQGQGDFGVWMLDPPGKQGAFGLMLGALREGTPTRTAAQITDEALDLGADIRWSTAGAFAPPSFRAAKSTWRPTLDLFADVLVNATLPEASVARVKSTMSGVLDRLSPISLANRSLIAGLYGPASLNGQFATSATMKEVTRDDVAAIKDRYLRPQNVMFVVAGDVTVGEAREALAKSLGGWQRGGTTIAVTPPAPTPAPTTIYLKDSPNQAQALLVAGQLVPGRDHADAAAIETLVSVLGDFSVSAGSRVYNAFRIERGLSYSPRVEQSLRPLGEMPAMYTTAAVPPTVVDTAITVLLRVLRDVKQDKPVVASELDFSKRNLLGRFPGDLERVDLTAGIVAQQMRDRLPPDYLSKWLVRVAGLGLPEVQAAAAKYLDPDHMVIAVVADRAKVESALRATGIPVVIVP